MQIITRIITQHDLLVAPSLRALADLLNAIHDGHAAFESDQLLLWPLPGFGGATPTSREQAGSRIYSYDETHFLVAIPPAPVRELMPAFALVARAALLNSPELPASAAPPEPFVSQLRHWIEWTRYARRTISDAAPLPPSAAADLGEIAELARSLATSANDLVDELAPLVPRPAPAAPRALALVSKEQ